MNSKKNLKKQQRQEALYAGREVGVADNESASIEAAVVEDRPFDAIINYLDTLDYIPTGTHYDTVFYLDNIKAVNDRIGGHEGDEGYDQTFLLAFLFTYKFNPDYANALLEYTKCALMELSSPDTDADDGEDENPFANPEDVAKIEFVTSLHRAIDGMDESFYKTKIGEHFEAVSRNTTLQGFFLAEITKLYTFFSEYRTNVISEEKTEGKNSINLESMRLVSDTIRKLKAMVRIPVSLINDIAEAKTEAEQTRIVEVHFKTMLDHFSAAIPASGGKGASEANMRAIIQEAIDASTQSLIAALPPIEKKDGESDAEENAQEQFEQAREAKYLEAVESALKDQLESHHLSFAEYIDNRLEELKAALFDRSEQLEERLEAALKESASSHHVASESVQSEPEAKTAGLDPARIQASMRFDETEIETSESEETLSFAGDLDIEPNERYGGDFGMHSAPEYTEDFMTTDTADDEHEPHSEPYSETETRVNEIFSGANDRDPVQQKAFGVPDLSDISLKKAKEAQAATEPVRDEWDSPAESPGTTHQHNTTPLENDALSAILAMQRDTLERLEALTSGIDVVAKQTSAAIDAIGERLEKVEAGLISIDRKVAEVRTTVSGGTEVYEANDYTESVEGIKEDIDEIKSVLQYFREVDEQWNDRASKISK